jgi:predicted nucleotidyltransferase
MQMKHSSQTIATPDDKRRFLERLVGYLSQVPEIVAVVLGGSYATGTFDETSDLDIGLYYREAKPFSIVELERIANSISNQGAATITEFYEWGRWVNGGAWIQTEIGEVDFLYRNIDQVEQTIREAQQGTIAHDYDQQPTYGFYSVIYLAEIQVCVPLFDPHSQIVRLKRWVEAYPPKLKRTIIRESLWSAEFTLRFAREFAACGDVYNTVGCLTRMASNLTQALFALNERYFIGDKRVMERIASFPILPTEYGQRIVHVLSSPGRTSEELSHAVSHLETLWREVVSLAGDAYQPKYS